MYSKHDFRVGKEIAPSNIEIEPKSPLRIDNDNIRFDIVNFIVYIDNTITELNDESVKKQLKQLLVGNFTRNINKANITIKKSLFSRNNSSCTIDGDSIDIVASNSQESLVYELFRLFGYSKDGSTTFLGLSQSHEENGVEVVVGEGLNEGYLDLITDHYCRALNYRNNPRNDYGTTVARRLEYIFGWEKMFTFYAQRDLNGLVNELAQYSSVEEAREFVQLNDFYHFRDSANLGRKEKTQRVKEAVDDINSFLKNMFDIRMQELGIEGEARENEEEYFLSLYGQKKNTTSREEKSATGTTLDLRQRHQ